jgi:hypothetical protein
VPIIELKSKNVRINIRIEMKIVRKAMNVNALEFQKFMVKN